MTWDEYDDMQAGLWWDEREAYIDRHGRDNLPDRLKTESEAWNDSHPLAAADILEESDEQ